jgi:hypothetical protein
MARVEQQRSERQIDAPTEAQVPAALEEPVDDGWIPPWEI